MSAPQETLTRLDELETLIVQQDMPWASKVALTEYLDGWRDSVETNLDDD